MYERYVNFFTDFAFKKLFGTEKNKDLLVSFLNASLCGKEVVVDLEYLDIEKFGNPLFVSGTILDVCCKTMDGKMFFVELQNVGRQFCDQIVLENKHEGCLEPAYTISILDFSFDDSRSAYYLYEQSHIYLEMSKFIKLERDLESLLDKWMYAIKNMMILSEQPKALCEGVFAKFFEAAEIVNLNPQERAYYGGSLKNYRDWYSVVNTAITRGREKGLVAGRVARERLEKEQNIRNLK